MAKYLSDAELDSWFSYHQPTTPEIVEAHNTVRKACRELAQVFSDLLPEGPDKTTALQAVRLAMYKANACIAVRQYLFDPMVDDLL